MSQMEGQEQAQPATNPQQDQEQQQQPQQSPSLQQQQPPQGNSGNMTGQENDHQAGPIGGIPMNLPVGQPQIDASAFANMGRHAGFAPESQQAFNGNNGFFAPPNMMFPPNQQIIGNSNGTSPEHAVNGNAAISADEIALYDRQIRLWGIKAQRKIQAANILLISMKALANEIAKNLVLAGIGSLTLLDDQNVSEADLGAQFFLSEETVGQNRAEAASREIQKLNPRVKVIPDTGSIMDKGVSYFSAFDIVIATDLNATTLTFLNTATRVHHRQFYAAGCHGYYGYVFCDLIEHDFVLQRDKGNVSATPGQETRTRWITDVKTQKEGEKTIELVAKRELYSTWDLASETSALPAEYIKSTRRLRAVTPVLSCLRALWAFEQLHNRAPGHNRQDLEFFTKAATQCHAMLSLPGDTLNSEILRSFLQNIGSEVAPVAAVIGGQLAQDVINVLSQSQQPIQNLVIFDGNRMDASQYALHPEGPLGFAQLSLANPMMSGMMPMGDPQMGDPQMGIPQMGVPQMGGHPQGLQEQQPLQPQQQQ